MTNKTHQHNLITVLTGQADLLAQLNNILKQEETALTENNAEKIENLAKEKIALTGKLDACENERTTLCQMLGISPDRDGIRMLINNADPSAKSRIKTLWQRVFTLGQECSNQNKLNGILVAHQQRHVRDALSILRGAVASIDMYSNKGSHEALQARHTLGKV